MDSIVLERGFERFEVFLSEIAPEKAIPGITVQSEGTRVTITLPTLEENARYLVVVMPDVKDLAGVSLSALWCAYFASRYSPLYCSLQDVVGELGSVSSELTPGLVYDAIRDASRLADYLTGVTVTRTEIPFPVGEFVKYRAAYTILSQIITKRVLERGESYTLGDLRVDLRPPRLKELTDGLRGQMDYWRSEMLAAARRGGVNWTVRGYFTSPVPASRQL
ncbi:MAG: Ig-like domain-containing protein [Bacillota bacterium]